MHSLNYFSLLVLDMLIFHQRLTCYRNKFMINPIWLTLTDDLNIDYYLKDCSLMKLDSSFHYGRS